MRGGAEEALRGMEKNALWVVFDGGSGADETERDIGRRLSRLAEPRLAGVRQVSGTSLQEALRHRRRRHRLGRRDRCRPQTTADAGRARFPTMELYAMPAATATLLDDSAVNIDDGWRRGRDRLRRQEGTAFVTGDGDKKPTGFLSYTTVAEASWAWEKIGYVSTGVDGAWPAATPSDILVDLVYALKAGYRQNGTWVMNRASQAAIRKMKDDSDNYIWQPAAVAGQPASLMTSRSPSPRTCLTSARTPSPLPSAISAAAI